MRRRPGGSGWTPRSREGASPHDAAPVHDQSGRRRPGRSARPARARALARRGSRRGVALWHERRVHEGAGRVLAAPLRLAGARDAPQHAPAVHRCPRRDRRPPHPRARRRARADAAPALARVAGLDRGFERILPMLTDPARFGGDPADAFTVVAPSLPGYGFSFRPDQPRFGVEEIADTFLHLMTDVLGYRRFAAQGGDWGAFITSRLGLSYPERVAGIHLNLLAVRRDPALPDKPTDEEQA